MQICVSNSYILNQFMQWHVACCRDYSGCGSGQWDQELSCVYTGRDRQRDCGATVKHRNTTGAFTRRHAARSRCATAASPGDILLDSSAPLPLAEHIASMIPACWFLSNNPTRSDSLHTRTQTRLHFVFTRCTVTLLPPHWVITLVTPLKFWNRLVVSPHTS